MSEHEAQAAGSPRPRITPQRIQEKEFRLSFRGYNEREVDEFLDEVTEAVAELIEENRRLRERLGSGSEGEEVLRRAREEADRIVREAEARAARVAAPVGPADREAIGPFIATEREFLQRLGQLVQAHAEEIKEMVRRARERAEPAASPPAGPP
ncbi:MAG TPA: DivIVA domain-containing protein, partial [Actinomycetota bacterium]|nr:DivIVA domain-containing protein [Actinomycetota bacterium]